MQTAWSFTTLSARGTRFKMFPNGYKHAKRQENSHFHWMHRGLITSQGQKRQSVWWNNEHAEQSAALLLVHIVQSLKMCLVLHILLYPQRCSICPSSMHTVPACQYELWVFACYIITFLWKVASRAATMILFPKLAISSQNSTVSGN